MGQSSMLNKVLILRLSFWAGAVLDVLAFLTMLFPALFALNYGLIGFNPGMEYRYAMGMGAPLMIGWTLLLLWASHRPIERKSILLITLPVIFGEVVAEVFGVKTGFFMMEALIPILVIQALLSALFVYSYWNASR